MGLFPDARGAPAALFWMPVLVLFGCGERYIISEGKAVNLTGVKSVTSDPRALALAASRQVPRERLVRPDGRPVRVSPKGIDLGDALPPDGASVLEHVSREIEKEEGPGGTRQPGETNSPKEAAEKPEQNAEPTDVTSDPATQPASPSASVQPVGPPPDERTALQWLNSGSERRKAAACRFFAGFPTPRALRPLGRLALSRSRSARFAMDALSALAGSAGAGMLAKAALGSPVPANRWYAAAQLCYGVGAEADGLIPALMTAHDYNVRMLGIRASGGRRLVGAGKVLQRVLADGSLPEGLRLEAAGSLVAIGRDGAAAKAFLARALDRGGISVLRALEVLARTPGDWPALVLAGALLSSDERVAYLALSGLALRHPGQSMRALEQAFGPPLDQHGRVLMARGILRALDDPSTVVEMLRNEEAGERYLACRVAGFLRLTAATDRLKDISRTDEHPSVRAAAAQALRFLRTPVAAAPDWVPRAVTRVYLSPERELEGAFITDMKGEEAFFRLGERLPNGAVLEGFSGGQLRLRDRAGAEDTLAAPQEAVRVRKGR